MPWPVHPNGLLGAQGDEDSYRIARSLRFNSADSAYLNRTPSSSSNQKLWTFSAWCKSNANYSSIKPILGARRGAGNGFSAQFTTNGELEFLDYNTSYNFRLITTRLFRDPSAWYHIVFVYNSDNSTAALRARIYVNGVEITSFSTSTYPTLSFASAINQNVEQRIGNDYGTSPTCFDGYLTEINLIDGQALTPSSFGETDPITGRWKAKAYSGSYGTNGFYLNFSDNSGTTATTLGKDSSSNGNNWTPNNFSVTSGAGNDSLVDSPTNYGTDTGVGGEVRGNYATLNALDKNSNISLSNGNLNMTTAVSAANQQIRATISLPNYGKWYWESTNSGSVNNFNVGITGLNASLSVEGVGDLIYNESGVINNNGSTTSGYSTLSLNDIVGMAYNATENKLYFYKNNTLVNVGGTTPSFDGPYSPMFGVYNSGNSQSVNFGQRPFAYTAPSGFKALCTQNLSQPTIQKPSKFMDALAYTGTGASNSISSLGFSPDLVWIKNRGTTTSHAIYDTTRGAQKQLSSDTTGAEVTSSTGLTAFGSNGFTVGTSTLVNTSGTQYAAWSWDESPVAGMDIVSYTGTGAIRTVSHNLGVAPKMIIVKLTNSAGFQWPVYHSSLTSASSYIWLNSTNAQATDASYWGTAPTSSVFSVGTNANVNNNTSSYIAYCFAEIEGYSKFGSYTGNGSADGPFVWCGFRPRYILFKCSSTAATNWIIHDTARNDVNLSAKRLMANTADAEVSDNGIDILSNGFKMRSADGSTNTSGGTHIFAAFAESPFKYARAR